jgi:signal transduction histidine kinase
VGTKPGLLQAPARIRLGSAGPLGVLVLARWRWLAPVIVIVSLGLTDLQHRHPPATAAVVWLFTASGVATQLTRERAERALHGRTFLRAPMAWAHVACLLGLFGTSVTLCFLQSGATGPIGLFIAVMGVVRLLPLAATAALALASSCAVGLSASSGSGTALNGALSGFLFSAAFTIVTLIVWARIGSEQAAQLEQRAVALAERQRLAREMHDVLAHSLSGLMLQLEGARMLAKENPADPRLPGIIERAHHLGRTGLDEARRAIGMLRDDELPGPEQLKTLVEQFERDSGIPCELVISGTERPLGSQASLAVYRVAQEALTNVRKHARPERVGVRLAYSPGRTCLTVEDFGRGDGGPRNGGPPVRSAGRAAPAGVRLSGGGYGLTGMRERAELLGGSLTAAPAGHGFRVELQVPG